MFLSKNDYLLSDGRNTNICRTKRACVRVARWPLASLHTPSPYIHRGWGCGVRGAMRRSVSFFFVFVELSVTISTVFVTE